VLVAGLAALAIEQRVIWSRHRQTIAGMVLEIRMSYPRRSDGFSEAPIRFPVFYFESLKAHLKKKELTGWLSLWMVGSCRNLA
jgi:hypothetical protein